jgi:hypothetical protein
MPVWIARIASQSRKSIDAKTRDSLLPPQQDSVDMMDGNSVGVESGSRRNKAELCPGVDPWRSRLHMSTHPRPLRTKSDFGKFQASARPRTSLQSGTANSAPSTVATGYSHRCWKFPLTTAGASERA